jgi:Fe-S cluster assembly protein SufD
LLLDNSAEANSLPGLEILANDVKCSHGATTGQIDPEQLYYMRTRGISQSRARKLLVYGFFEEILESIPQCEVLNEQIRVWIEKQFHD